MFLRSFRCAVFSEASLSRAVSSSPLTFLQQGMLVHHLRAPDGGVDIEQVVVTLPERVDAAALGAAWQRLVDHYEVLRSAFVWRRVDVPEQRVVSTATLPVEVRDWTTTSVPARSAALVTFLHEDRRRGLPLDVAPLMRVTIGRWSADEAVLVWTFHHALLDGRCFPVLLREAFASYEAARDGRALPALPERGDFAAFAAWVVRRDVAASDAFWRAMVGEVSSPTAIPVLRAVAPGAVSAQGDAERWVDASEVTALRALAERAGVTLNTVVQAAWALLLARYSGEAHVTFGVTRAGRRDTVPGADEMLGLFITTVPMRVAVPEDATVVEWLRTVRAQWTALAPHEHTPLARIQSLSGVGAGRPLVESIVMFEQYELDARMRADGGAWARRTVRLHEQNGFALTLAAYADERLLLRLEFDRSRVDDDAVQRMLAHLATGLTALVAQADAPVSTLHVLPEAERRLLLETWAGALVPRTADTLAHLLLAQAARTPDGVAVEDERRSLTYAELSSAARALARRLRASGVGPGVRVGVAAERSVELVIALVGVVLAGGCYVPVDPEYPPDRVQFMLGDADVPLLLTTAAVAPTLPPITTEVMLLDGSADARDAGDALPMPSADEPAYMIYTSGSTGRPKGAVNAHRGIVNRLLWMQDEYRLSARDVVLQKTPFSFDVSVWEFFWPLITGARLVMAKPGGHRDARYLAEVMRARGVTVCHFVPSMLRAFVESGVAGGCTSLRDVMASGEALPGDLVAAFYQALPGARLHNLYGPTECAVDVSYWPCPPSVTASDIVPIGRAVANTRLYVLDAMGRLCPIGVPGELFLAGVQVGVGYHGRPDLTAERFVPDPFAPSDEPRARMYKTGDLARWRADGTVEYLGRLDFQVKLRGFRIELGEIEAVLREHASVQDAVVVARALQPGNMVLVAYVQPAPGAAPDAQALRAFVGTRLPDYMVPTTVMSLPALPLSPSGKVDRKALPDPELRLTTAQLVAPRDDYEARILRLWQQLLGTTNIGVTDRFNDVGGHSLAAVQLFSRIAKEFGREFPLVTILKHDTVEKIAALLRGPSDAEAWHCIVPLNNGGAGQAVFCLPPHSGRLLLYQHLAKELEGRHPFRGVQGYGNWGTQQPMASVEAAAAYYADEIVKAQPAGPYALYGISMGGWLALEVARVLRQRGLEVNFVAMHDSRGPGYPQFSLRGRIVKWVREHGGISFGRLKRIFKVAPAGRVALRAYARVLRDVLRNAREQARWWRSNTYRDFLVGRYTSRPVPLDLALPDNVTRLWLAERRLRAQYRPVFYDGHPVLFRAAIQEYGAAPNPHNGWASVVSSLEIVPTAGGHTGALFRPEVVQYAKDFEVCLARHVGGGSAAEKAAG